MYTKNLEKIRDVELTCYIGSWRKKAIQIGTNLEIIRDIELTCYIGSWRKKAIQIGTNLEIIWYIELTCYISSWRKKVIQIGSNSIHRMTHTTIFAVIVKHTSSTHEYCAELNQNITSVHKEKKTFCA